jgi:hypothetical protein
MTILNWSLPWSSLIVCWIEGPIAVIMKGIVIWQFTDVSEEHTSPNFRVED